MGDKRSVSDSQKKQIGDRGEGIIAIYLEKKGYNILARNFSCKRGEIDLVVQKNEIVAFVEVKTRKTAYFSLSSVVTRSKQQKIIASAKWFLCSRKMSGYVYRFDVATVLISGVNHGIDYIPHAFAG